MSTAPPALSKPSFCLHVKYTDTEQRRLGNLSKDAFYRAMIDQQARLKGLPHVSMHHARWGQDGRLLLQWYSEEEPLSRSLRDLLAWAKTEEGGRNMLAGCGILNIDVQIADRVVPVHDLSPSETLLPATPVKAEPRGAPGPEGSPRDLTLATTYHIEPLSGTQGLGQSPVTSNPPAGEPTRRCQESEPHQRGLTGPARRDQQQHQAVSAGGSVAAMQHMSKAERAKARLAERRRRKLEEELAGCRDKVEIFRLESRTARRLRNTASQLLLDTRREMAEKATAAGLALEAAEQKTVAAELAKEEAEQKAAIAEMALEILRSGTRSASFLGGEEVLKLELSATQQRLDKTSQSFLQIRRDMAEEAIATRRALGEAQQRASAAEFAEREAEEATAEMALEVLRLRIKLASSLDEVSGLEVDLATAEGLRDAASQIMLETRREMAEKAGAARQALEEAEQRVKAADGKAFAKLSLAMRALRPGTKTVRAKDASDIDRDLNQRIESVVGARPSGSMAATASTPRANKRPLDAVDDGEVKPCKIPRGDDAPFDEDSTRFVQ